MSLDLGNKSKVPSLLENWDHCLADIRLWMTRHLLKLNDGKTDIIYMFSSCNAKSIKTLGLQIGESCITLSGSVRKFTFSITAVIICAGNTVCSTAYVDFCGIVLF